jgi:hypothetical protein
MNSRTLILVHPQQKRTLQNKIIINQEINNLIRQKRIKNFTLKTYNKQLRNEIKKIIFFKILNKKSISIYLNKLIKNCFYL